MNPQGAQVGLGVIFGAVGMVAGTVGLAVSILAYRRDRPKVQVRVSWDKRQYARSGLQLGLKYQEEFGANPFQFGLVGAGDSHTSLPGQEENNYWGKHSSSEPDAERWETPFRVADIGTQEGWSEVASGITGIWATENTRAAL